MLASAPRVVRLKCAVNVGKRAYHDLVTLPSQKPIVASGPPGYSAVSGRVITVFGCTGFLGRYVVSKLGKVGTQVVCPYRDEDEARILKPMGDLGQIVRMEWDIRNEQTIAECLRHSDTVINLVGRDYETKNFDFQSVNAIGAERIARIAKENGVERFIQVSHLNASEISPSKFYATKAEGEKRVKEVFPEATIVRPGSLFGYEDKFLTNMAVWPIWWRLNHGETTVRPAHVMDVAQALVNLTQVPQAELSRTLNLPGPATYTYNYLLELIASVTVEPVSKAPVVPKRLALLLAKLGDFVWWPTLSPDEVIRRYINDSDVPGDWDAVGIPEPAEIESLAITYLRRYRAAANFVRPVVLPPRAGVNTTVETR